MTDQPAEARPPTAPPASVGPRAATSTPGRWRLDAALHPVVEFVRRFAFTIAAVVAITVIGAFSGTAWRADHAQIMREIGVDLGVLLHFRLDHLLLSTFYQSQPGIDWRMVVAIALIVGALEYLAGTLRAAATFVLSDIVTSVLTVLALTALGAAGWHYAHTAARTPDSGSSVAMLASAGALSMMLTGWKRKVGLVTLAAYVFPAFLWWSFATWLGHLIGTCVGIAFGAIFARQRARAEMSR